MANHVMVNLDKIAALQNGNIESVVHTVDMDNGSLINLGGIADPSNPELKQVVVPSTATLGSEEVLLVHSPEVQGNMYLPGTELKDFYNPANKPARALHLTVGDIFTITSDGVDGTPAVGKYIIPQNGSLKPIVADDLSGNTRFAAKIISMGKFGYTGSGLAKQDAITVQVVKA